MTAKNRTVTILKYLWDCSDETNPVTTNDIIEHLAFIGIITTRKTVTEDIAELQSIGIDIVCNRSRQNEYFIGTRHLELAELKLLVDAVQAAKFLSPKKSMELIGKLSSLASPHQGDLLKRSLYVDGKAKTENEKVFYSVDTLYTAIQTEKTVTFKYIEYTAEKKQVYKHNGKKYVLSPYDMVWCNDAYYVFGWSESHGMVVKFRVDRMYRPTLSDEAYRPKPNDYDIASFCRKVFSMYDGQLCTVELKCENSMMKNIIDRFGENVQTVVYDYNHFTVTVEVSVSPTFYAWVFTYGEKVEILSPPAVREEYAGRLKTAINKAE
ncbi:MAG: helix-turn-helix transcriptional regulator [Acutalibacteraceae bacterium]